MAVLLVGSTEVKKGVLYNGIVPGGNAVRLTEKVRVSINKSPFVSIPTHQDIITIPDYTYTFENDTAILLTRQINSDFDIIFTESCPTAINIPKNTTSADICSLTLPEDVTTGRVSVGCYVENMDNQEATVTIDVNVNGTSIGTRAVKVAKRTKASISAYLEFDSKSSGDIVTFTLNPNKELEVRGGEVPARIQIEKRT